MPYVQRDNKKNIIAIGDIKTQSLTEFVETAELYKTTDQVEHEDRENRLLAYQKESDPLFFKWQRGEINEEEWLNKVAEIKSRYPSTSA